MNITNPDCEESNKKEVKINEPAVIFEIYGEKSVLGRFFFSLLFKIHYIVAEISSCNIYAPASKDQGHVVLQLSVCLSVCPSVYLLKLNVKTLFENLPFSYFDVNEITRLIFGMKAHLMLG